MDTGSSDLWIKGQNSPLPNSNQSVGACFMFSYCMAANSIVVSNLQSDCEPSSLPIHTVYSAQLTSAVWHRVGFRAHILLYRTIFWVCHSLFISYTLRSFAFSISIPNQAFLDVSSAQNPAVTYGASGIMGLGFTSLSSIDAVVNKTGSSSGRSLLYNLFSANPKEPNFIAISLQRSSDPIADVEGTFLIGELDPDYSAVNQTPPIPTFPVVNPTRWTVILEGILDASGNTTVPMTSTVPDAPSNRAVALLDSGTSYRCVCIPL